MIARRFVEIVRRCALLLIALLPAKEAFADTYWQRYQACLLADPRNSGYETECRSLATQLQTEVTAAVRTTTAITGGQACQTATEYFSGTGFVIDRASCGPRSVGGSGCSVSSLADGCPAESSFPAPPDTSGSPLVTWCDTCRTPSSSPLGGGDATPQGCYVCEDREDIVDSVASTTREQIQQLFSCFGPADPARTSPHVPRADGTYGPFPNSKLLKKLQQTYQHFLASGGVTVRCPGNDRTPDGGQGKGFATADSGTISLEPAGIGDSSTFAHEFMHLSSAMGSGGIDDQSAATHNHPNDTCPYSTNSTGADVRDNSLERPLQNRRYDRVYSCEKLCFGGGLLTAEECGRCLSYPGAPKTGSRMPAPCRDLMTLDELSEWESVKASAAADARECESDLQAAISRITSRGIFTGDIASGGASAIASRPKVIDSAVGSCLSAHERPLNKNDQILAARPSDSRNRDRLRSERFPYAFANARYKLMRACAYREYFQQMQFECERQSSGSNAEFECRKAIRTALTRAKERQPHEWSQEIIDAKLEWNNLRTEASTPLAGRSYSADEIKATGVQEICESVPPLPTSPILDVGAFSGS